MRTRTRGIIEAADGSRLINKQYKRHRIFIRLGKVTLEEAERRLRAEQQRIDDERQQAAQRNFCDAAGKYIRECQVRKVRTLETIAYHLRLILPHVGTLPLEAVHRDSLSAFVDQRLEDGASPTTVNRTLEVVRTVLNRAARVWRGDDGKPWLSSPPLIEMLTETPRATRPITWEEQKRLLVELPAHLEKMALFAVNTGLRDDNVCGLRWDWEVKVPELDCSVFVIPPEHYKAERHHVVVLNDVASAVVESCRGQHAEFVFTYQRGHGPAQRVETMNNTGWQSARERAKLGDVRVHDLRHTFAQRLRQAGVSDEDRKLLLGHAVTDMAGHYAVATIARLIDMANAALETRDTPTLQQVINSSRVAQKVAQQKKTA